MRSREESIRRLRKAYKERNLTLYLGAGVSVATGIPTWEQLVLAMYYSAISQETLGGWRPFSNYLLAISEWHLERSDEPLEITARKIRLHYQDQDEFLAHLRQTLYAGFFYGGSMDHIPVEDLNVGSNKTLVAVAQICKKSILNQIGIRSVITYNYDNLLEIALRDQPVQPIWEATQRLKIEKLPIYHVHGYVPLGKTPSSTGEEIVFTEDQYHRTSQDAYSWRNLVQIQSMSNSIGLMVGLSLSDRNMRRLLDAVMRTPLETENYALLQEPDWGIPDEDDINRIHERAMDYMDRFSSSGMPGTKGEGARGRQIRGILEEVEKKSVAQNTAVLSELGIYPLWYKDHAEVPDILAEVVA